MIKVISDVNELFSCNHYILCNDKFPVRILPDLYIWLGLRSCLSLSSFDILFNAKELLQKFNLFSSQQLYHRLCILAREIVGHEIFAT